MLQLRQRTSWSRLCQQCDVKWAVMSLTLGVAGLVVLLVLLGVPVTDRAGYLQGTPTTATPAVARVRTVQNFPIKDTLNHSDSTLNLDPFRVNMSEVSKFHEVISPDFYREKARLSNMAHTNSTSNNDVNILTYFAPLMTSEKKAQLMFTMDVFIRACEKYGWDYFLVGGTLLGAWRHHGMIPWDDDVDILMNGSDWMEIRHVLGNMPGFSLWANSAGVWRFFLTDLPPIPGSSRRYKWPFLDLFFFDQNDTHLWGLTDHVQYMMFPLTYIRPLKTARWERWELPVPACVEKMLMREYKGKFSTCVSSLSVHEKGTTRPTHEVPCSRLYRAFPFVFRCLDTRSQLTVESRRVGDRILEEISVPQEPSRCSEWHV